MTTVILAEKPSQALAYAEAFQKFEKKNGFFKITDSLFQEETVITFGFGHLVELIAPQDYDEKFKKWNLDHLPIFPEPYRYTVPEDKQKQFAIVSEHLRRSDTIIIATDSDREGSNIAWSIIHHAKAYDKNKTYKRLWINSLEKEAIREGFRQLKSGSSDIPAYKEAQTRQISDWLVGMNASPLYSLSLQKKNIQGVFSIGRVQTPTLYMIFQRQQEIETFVKTPYLELEGRVSANQSTFKATLDPPQRFKNKVELDHYMDKMNVKEGRQAARIASVETTTKEKNSPSLFSLSSLQKKANSLFKISAKETLKVVQSLYEAKLLTYPRTDTPFITQNEFTYLKQNIDDYLNFLGINESATQTEPRKSYVNDKKVQEHHAIILTKKVPSKTTFDKLTPIQQKLYLLVAKTTVAMFLPNYVYEETEIKTAVGQLMMKSKGHVPLGQGWKVLFQEEQKKSTDKEPMLPKVMTGQSVDIELQGKQKETQPPKPYNEGSIIIAMKTAGKTVDDDAAKEMLNEVEGIGTEATRADVIETLKKRAYILSEKNQLVITEKGRILCEAVQNQQLLTSAEMTAKWEVYLKKIGQGTGSQEAFLTNIKKFIEHLLKQVPADIETLDTQQYIENKQKKTEKNTVGKCPKCGSPLISKKSFYGCTNYPTCRFTLATNFRKKKLTKKNLSELLEKNATTVTKVKAKDGKKTYNAHVKLNDKGYIAFVSFAK